MEISLGIQRKENEFILEKEKMKLISYVSYWNQI